MNTLKNRVQLIGNLGMNPEVRSLGNNRKMANFRMATSESYRGADGKRVEHTQWHNVIAWGAVAEIAERYLKKGKEVAVKGKLVHRTYDDKNGNKRYITEVVASELLMLGNQK